MHVKVVGADVIGLNLEDVPQHCNDLSRADFGSTVRSPPFPGVQHHQAFRVQDRSVVILWIACAERGHCVLERDIQRSAIRRFLRGIALAQCFDVVALLPGRM